LLQQRNTFESIFWKHLQKTLLKAYLTCLPEIQYPQHMSKMETWTTEDTNGKSVFWTHWKTDQPKAVIVLIHGMGEHIRRYDHVAEFWNEHQVDLLGLDFPGFGQSYGKRGHSEGLEGFLSKVDAMIQKAKAVVPDCPVFLFGQSMGGNIAMNYALRSSQNIQGVISSSPWIRLAKQPPALLLSFGRLMSNIYPAYSQGNGLELKYLSRDTKVVDRYIADPLVHGKVTAATAISLLDGAAQLDQFSGTFPVPLLLQHGAEDGITSPEASRLFADRVSGQLSFRLWEGAYHELHNEPNQLEVLQFCYDWLKERI
jgi:alpha-beta hydrolase superfamily lysophospholipase